MITTKIVKQDYSTAIGSNLLLPAISKSCHGTRGTFLVALERIVLNHQRAAQVRRLPNRLIQREPETRLKKKESELTLVKYNQ